MRTILCVAAVAGVVDGCSADESACGNCAAVDAGKGGAALTGGRSNGGGGAQGGGFSGGAAPVGGAGTSNGGASNGGASNGGASNGGTSNGGTSNGGTSNGGTSNGGALNGGTAGADASIGGAPSGSGGTAANGGSSSGGGSGSGGTTSNGGGPSNGGALVDGGSDGATDGAAGSGSGGAPTRCDVTVAKPGECDLLTQNCPSGQTCSIEAADVGSQTGCQIIGTGTSTLFGPCSANADCAPGFNCWFGHCTRPCCLLPDYAPTTCGPVSWCSYVTYFPIPSPRGNPYVRYCRFPDCVPWQTNCASPGRACHHVAGTRFNCDAVAAGDPSTFLGKPCTSDTECAESQACVGYDGSDPGACRWLCKVSDSGAPNSGTVGGQPGQGGCEANETCVARGASTWLGQCEP